MAMRERTARRSGAITFHHPGAFWFGISAATVGTLLTPPEYWTARHTCKLVPTTVPGSPLVKQCFVLAGFAPLFHAHRSILRRVMQQASRVEEPAQLGFAKAPTG